MINGLIGKKIGMTNIFGKDRKYIPVTIIEAGPCIVVQKKNNSRDGYEAVQLGFHPLKKKRTKKPQAGLFKKMEVEPLKILKEFRGEEIEKIKIGEQVKVDIFKTDERVNIKSISKGRGFAGVVKRHGFAGFPASRGTHEYFRHGGSIGQHSSPSKVFKNVKMAGRMGGGKVTLKNIKVVKILKEDNLLLVQGGIPGPNGVIVEIRKRK